MSPNLMFLIKNKIEAMNKKILSDWKFTLISVTKHSKLFFNCKNVINFQIYKESVWDIKILENLGKKFKIGIYRYISNLTSKDKPFFVKKIGIMPSLFSISTSRNGASSSWLTTMTGASG